MSNTADSLTALSRRTWIGLVASRRGAVCPRQPHRQEQQPSRHRKQRVLRRVRDRRRAADHAGDRHRRQVTPGSIAMSAIARAAAILGAGASILACRHYIRDAARPSSGLPTLTLALNGRSVAGQRPAPVRGGERRLHRERQAHRTGADPPPPGSPVLSLRPGRCGDQRPPRRPQLPRPVRLDRVRRQRRQGNHQRPDDATARQLPGGRPEQQQPRPARTPRS